MVVRRPICGETVAVGLNRAFTRFHAVFVVFTNTVSTVSARDSSLNVFSARDTSDRAVLADSDVELQRLGFNSASLYKVEVLKTAD